MKAGSTFPPLARSTAFTTAASIDGKASFRVFSACCSGANGRGGLGGATSSLGVGCGTADDVAAFSGGVGVSVGSSSKSKALAVVGDSGGPSGFYDSERYTGCSTLPRQHTVFSTSDILSLLEMSYK